MPRTTIPASELAEHFAFMAFRFPEPEPGQRGVPLSGGPFDGKVYPVTDDLAVCTIHLPSPFDPRFAANYDRRMDEPGAERWIYREP